MTLLPMQDLTGSVSPELADAKEASLLASLAAEPRVLVAFSGGVDSTYLAWAAFRALGERAVAVTGVSASVPAEQLDAARALAAQIGIEHRLIDTREMEDARYRENSPERCYWCKSELYTRLAGLGAAGGAVVLDGTNHDDLGDVRPGRRAAAELAVRSPLVEARLGKAEIRWLARRAELPIWHAPASPCLASRIPHGEAVSVEKLGRIERAESAVRALGFREFRVRHLSGRARIEVAEAELKRALEPAWRQRLIDAVLGSGFPEAYVDGEPFRSGRLREPTGPDHGEERDGQVH